MGFTDARAAHGNICFGARSPGFKGLRAWRYAGCRAAETTESERLTLGSPAVYDAKRGLRNSRVGFGRSDRFQRYRTSRVCEPNCEARSGRLARFAGALRSALPGGSGVP